MLTNASAYAHNLTKYFSGELAESFSALVRVLHSGQFKCVSPGDFKRTVGKFKSQFSGYDQQDSQELLAFLMDGLQEDLNKVLLVLVRLSNVSLDLASSGHNCQVKAKPLVRATYPHGVRVTSYPG